MLLDRANFVPKPFHGSNVVQKRTKPSAARCSAAQVTKKVKPDWTGDAALSKMVNAAIGFKPFFSVLKVLAKRMVEQTAEKNGIPWRQRAKELSVTEEVYKIREEIEDTSIQYPTYYLQPFHAYDQGNLEWTAAFEAESASLAIAYRTWKDPAATPQQALDGIRGNIFSCVEEFREQNRALQPLDILDVGCSVGVSSRYFAERYPEAQVTGLDLSPHFLAVAELQERKAAESTSRRRIRYLHRFGERSGLPAESFDLVNLGFIIHECPPSAIRDLAAEAFRLLRRNGMLVISDNDPRSETLQNLPPVIFTLMKSTEPWSDEYYQMDLEAALREVGFGNVKSEASDSRHRAVMGFKP